MQFSEEGTRRELAGLLEDPPGALLVDRALRSLGRAVGHDGCCLFGVDPVTGLRSVMFSRHGLTVSTEDLVHNETVEDDVNRYVDLVRSGALAGTLTPRGTPRSRRLHELLPHDGYRSELRLALSTPGHYWGALSLFRDDRRRPFSDADVATARALGPWLAEVLRRYQVGGPQRAHAETGCGVIWVDRSDRVIGMDHGARQWLTGLTGHWEAGTAVEDVMRCVQEVAAAARRGASALSRTRVTDGRWLVASGAYVGGSVADVVVQLRPGDIGTILPAFAAWCGASAREVDVLRLLVQGLSAKQVARRLDLSVLTIGDHQRSLYRKARVTGRDELVALLV